MAILGYKLRVNGGALVDHIIDVGNVLAYDITGLEADTEYAVEVASVDLWGNQSDWSAPVSQSTTAIDIEDITGWVFKLRTDLGLSDGASVASWTDASGNNNHAVSIAPENKPTFLTNQQNGKPAIYFDGASKFMNLPNCVSALTEGEIFAVVYSSVAYPDGNNGIWHFGTPASNELFSSNFGEAIGTAFGRTDINYFTPSSSVRQRWLLVNISVKAGTNNFKYRINGAVEFQDTVTVGFNTAPLIALGGGGNYFFGKFGDIWVNNHVLTDAERGVVTTYLMSYWGIS